MTTLTAYGINGFVKVCKSEAEVQQWMRIANRTGCTRVVCSGEVNKTVFFA